MQRHIAVSYRFMHLCYNRNNIPRYHLFLNSKIFFFYLDNYWWIETLDWQDIGDYEKFGLHSELVYWYVTNWSAVQVVPWLKLVTGPLIVDTITSDNKIPVIIGPITTSWCPSSLTRDLWPCWFVSHKKKKKRLRAVIKTHVYNFSSIKLDFVGSYFGCVSK